MHFARTEEQDELATAIRGILGKRSNSEAVRAAVASEAGYDVALWETLCEQIGVAALSVPEEYDGFGASLVETAVVLEVLGEFLTPAPLLASALHASQLLLEGSEEEKSDVLPRLAAGEVLPFALDRVVLEPAESSETMDQTLRLSIVDVGVETSAEMRAISTALASALQVGAMQRALDMTVQYSQERVQFGRTIGSFQALKHRMADMLVLLEASRSASWGATALAAAYLADPSEHNSDRLVQLAATAGSYCSDALDKIAGEAVQLHGGIAITWEHDIQLVFKRAHALSQLNGPAHRHRTTLLD